jgi:hypothetical protein
MPVIIVNDPSQQLAPTVFLLSGHFHFGIREKELLKWKGVPRGGLKFTLPMSALGQKLPRCRQSGMSVLSPKTAATVVDWRGR